MGTHWSGFLKPNYPQAQSHPITLQAWESVNTHTQPPEPHTHHVQELNDKAN